MKPYDALRFTGSLYTENLCSSCQTTFMAQAHPTIYCSVVHTSKRFFKAMPSTSKAMPTNSNSYLLEWYGDSTKKYAKDYFNSYNNKKMDDVVLTYKTIKFNQQRYPIM